MANTKIISVRIPTPRYEQILEECVEDGFTVTEWLEIRIHLFERVLVSNEALYKEMQRFSCNCKVAERIRKLGRYHKHD